MQVRTCQMYSIQKNSKDQIELRYWGPKKQPNNISTVII